MLKIRQFEVKDALTLCPVAVDDSLHNKADCWKVGAEENLAAGPAYTALYKNEPVASGGMRLLKDDKGNVGWVWLLVSRKAKKCPVSVLMSMHRMLAILIKDFKPKKIISESRKGFELSQRLLEHLGFKRMEKETKTHYLYVKEV